MKRKIHFLPVLLLLLHFLSGMAYRSNAADGDVITPTTSPRGWIIKTKSSAYQVIIDSLGKVKPVFYGSGAQASRPTPNAQWFDGIDEVTVRGGFAEKIPMVEVIFDDNVRDIDLVFVKGDIIEIDGRPVLKIVQRDRHYPLEAVSYIRVLEEFDILEKWLTIENTARKGDIKVENLQSGNIVLPSDEYILTHMSGKWGHEYQQQEISITPGVKSLQATDFKSFTNTAWFMVRPKQQTDGDRGPAWYGTIQYSGNWKIDIDRNYDGNVQIVGGINFWDTWWTLKPGSSFQTPKFITGYTTQGTEGSSRQMRAYVQHEVLPEKNRDALRPVIYNSWYATLFDVNEAQQLQLAEIAKRIGVEVFVIDDGWFKGRMTDSAGLGDWVPDKTKFPNGLAPLIRKINDMGMKFGLWVEPEMVNPKSDLYKAHPDWVFHFPNRDRKEIRNQLMLNLAREDVYQYLLGQLSNLLRDNNIEYLKWDHNRTLSEPGWPDAPASMQREVRIRYITNLYRLIDELRKRFPHVLFENCSSGGGRVDLGLLSRMDHQWVSDNTDPIDRIFIHYAYLNAFPANTMLSLVTYENNHDSISLDFKFDVAMAGILGIGNDIAKFTKEEIDLATEKVRQYKIIRPLVQHGIVYRLISPYKENRSALQYVSVDGKESAVLCYNMAEYLKGTRSDSKTLNMLRLQGLNSAQLYRIEEAGAGAGDSSGAVYSGEFLMNIGIEWPLKGAYNSKILHFKLVQGDL